MTTTPTPRTMKTLGARRRRAEAEIRAVDAQRAARVATAEAEHAEQQAAQRQALARTAELAAQVDELGTFLDEQRQREHAEWSKAYDRRQELMEQLRAVADAPIPYVRSSMEEHRAALADLGKYVDAAVQAEQDQLRREMDACESRRLWDHEFRQSFDRRHAREGCDCPGHRAWRREQP